MGTAISTRKINQELSQGVVSDYANSVVHERHYKLKVPTNLVVHVDPRMRGITAVAASEVVYKRRTTGGREVESYSRTLDLLAKSHWE